MPDSAEAYALAALELDPGNENCLAELLKALAPRPSEVLGYSPLVAGGGVCRYRLARAELELGQLSGPSVMWLLENYENGDPAVAADAGCWLSVLFPERGLPFISRAVELMPGEGFYRSILVDRLLEEGMTDEALLHFQELSAMGEEDFHYWQTASSVYLALENHDLALEASRKAFSLRMTPSSGADLGWLLYFRGRDLVRENRMSDALPYLIEASSVWNEDSSWALRADSLIDLMNQFTSVSSGFGEPF